MRIIGITVHHVSIPFRRPFGHSLSWRERTEAVLICITSDSGATGWGEILPRPYVTGESVGSVLSRELPEVASRWQGRTFADRNQVLSALREEQHECSALATRAGWELAVLDLAGKTFGFAAGDVLGHNIGPELEAGVVIGFDVPTDRLDKHCLLLRLAARRHVKVKVGRHDDIRRLQIVNAVLGPSIPIRVDANGAWSADEAISQLQQMQHCNVCSVEEPVAVRDLDGMRKVREKTRMNVVADESLCSLADARSIIAAQAADVFNIRIAKCGGFLASLDLVTMAKKTGLLCQLGTLVGETGILSRASEIFGERIQGFEFLEGKGQNRRLLVQDIVEGTQSQGTRGHGLGITISSKSIGRWAASTEKIPAQGVAT